MKKTLFTLSAILWVFSANTDALAHSTNRTTPVISIYNTIGFQLDNGVSLNFVTRRYGGHRHHYGSRHFRNHRHSGHLRSHRFGQRRGFRFNSYRPYYQPYSNYSQRQYQGHSNHYRGGKYYGFGNRHRQHSRHDRGRHYGRGYGHSRHLHNNHY